MQPERTEWRLEVADGVARIPADQWNRLVGPEGSPFLEHAWLSALEDTGCVGGATGWTPAPLVLRDPAGELVGACPLYVKMHGEGEFVFDYAWAEFASRIGEPYYPKLVAAIPFTPVTGQRVLFRDESKRAEIVGVFAQGMRALAGELGASSCHVLFVDEAEAAAFVRGGFFERLGFQFHWENSGYGSWDEFLSRFNSKKRHQLRRESTQPQRDGVRIETVPPDRIDTDVAKTMHAFYASTVDRYFYGRRYLNEAFFQQIARTLRERMAWVVASRDGTPIAGAFNVVKGHRLYGRYWGAREELPFLHFNVCYYHGIRHAIEHRLRVFEPGAGGEHKYVRGFLPTLTRSVHWIAHPRMSAVVRAHTEREAEAVRRHVEEGRAGGPYRPNGSPDPST